MTGSSVQCCVTSPPYFGLRDYGVDGQMGLEASPDEFVAGMVAVFREVRRVLADDGTLWLNIGDSYAGSRAGPQGETGEMANRSVAAARCREASPEAIVRGKRDAKRWGGGNLPHGNGIKPKDLIGIPWMLAFALRADGWYLRQEIIWSKPNPMPESVGDRCTKSHESIFLLSKSPRYYFDADAIAEPLAPSSVSRLAQNVEAQEGSDRVPGKTNGKMKAVARIIDKVLSEVIPTRNKRSVWEVATQPFKEAHFATFPPALVEPCILAGCPIGGTVLDPFFGAGTTGMVADRLQRNCVGIELNPAYAEIARNRISGDAGMFADIAA
ncbi:DNA-methyltransferase [Sphingomonas albertensis]|uniref:DNA-methyltransferase n=1 Tax=Sphingomonas albertensis TaxID=2762591 RepID=UPI0037DA0983